MGAARLPWVARPVHGRVTCWTPYDGGAQFWRQGRPVGATTPVSADVRRRHIIITPGIITPGAPTVEVPAPRNAAGQPVGGERRWLDVPFAEKDQAKQAGARWDAAARRWYAPRPGMATLARWAAQPPVPDLLPGEDRTLGSGLFVDLIPSGCWFTNVRSCVAATDWDRLRRMIVGRAGGVCEVCGAGPAPAAKVWLEAHERWTYDAAARVQRLGRLICLCTPCHTVTHFGLAQLRGRDTEAFAHLVAVTRMTPHQASRHIADAFGTWRVRSRITWSLDLSILTEAGIALSPPPAADARATVADRTLHAVRTPPPRLAPPTV